MEELREILKSEDLTQTEYQGRTFEVLIKSFKTHKKFLFPAFVLFGINGYVLKNFIVFQTISKEELITSFLITVAIEFILSLFQNSVISKIRGKNELDKTNLIFKSIVLSIIMTSINFSILIMSNNLASSIIIIVLALCFSYFRQVYLSRDLNFFESIEENFKLLDGNRKRIIIPFIVVNIIFYILSFIFLVFAVIIGNYSTDASSELMVIVILVLFKLADGINEFYRKILASIIFLNVEDNQ
ncbi:hypothetical protein JMUB5056_2118 [Leptotrichia hongkongensis]|uniref:Uncharacterized protein n=1 Tax=Leptotrichia hongkongensis TaxID=554406 RepID=A0A510LE26_9FUSO|nr:hypothetical protein [Leptotrichia hongkongensis]BBM60495.1 hypothetical protein JMUB5056_2118 [Leptotrichia hongkongensis]